MRDPKVFGIGFHKTGTKTLAAALRTLGYRVTGPNGVKDPDIANNALEMCFSLVGQFDAFQDNPWPVMYKTLDRAYPQSKFVLTVRPTDEWIASVVDYFGRKETPMRKWIYGAGSPLGNEQAYIDTYERHTAEVLDHFRARPGSLLMLRVTEGDTWATLCSFLGKAIPAVDFPHENKRTAGSG